MIYLIAEFCHISLKEPSNKGYHHDPEFDKNHTSETLFIDNKNSLLIHYIPDPNLLNYHNPDWSTFERYDYIQSYPSFPSPIINNSEYGNIIYFEVELILNPSFIEFMKAHWLIFSIGLRTDLWKYYLEQKQPINGGMCGWNKDSVAIHSDDGIIFIESGNGGYQSI